MTLEKASWTDAMHYELDLQQLLNFNKGSSEMLSDEEKQLLEALNLVANVFLLKVLFDE